MAHPYADRAKTGQQIANARYADGGDVPKLNPGHGGVGQQLSDSADVEKTGLNVGMRVGADEISGSRPFQNPSAYDARRRLSKEK